ncbi:MAG: hypothetical protein KBT69_05800 [Oceanihabitans sp.]|nr:hypothetical protein [Oceanihabitans sp.]
MKNKRLANSFKFRVDQNIIFCDVSNDFNEKWLDKDLEEIFSNTISRLSKGTHMPILINLGVLDFYTGIKVFKSLSNNSKIKSIVLSETFLVNSYRLKLFLIVQNIMDITIIPDAIFKNFQSARHYCNKNNQMYNALS